jgi:hypothetical protein
MSDAFKFALYVFCALHHSGQTSRLYRILSRLTYRYKIQLSDSAWSAIELGDSTDWVEEHYHYVALKERYANDTK